MGGKAGRRINAFVEEMSGALTWARSMPEGISVAACNDTNSISDSELAMCLGQEELERSKFFPDQAERRHFMFRRCFQRLFLIRLLAWKDQPDALRIQHGQDSQPKCIDAPLLQLSFSSSGSIALACASLNHAVGIDIEIIRPIARVTALAQRFFTATEAAEIASSDESERNIRFLTHWTAKEAGLKAMGLGIVSGLNKVVLKPQPTGYHLEINDNNSSPHVWNLIFPDTLPNAIIAVVHRQLR